MKTFLLDIFPKIERFSEKLDNLTLLTNQHWVSIDEILSNKTVYIFRSTNELLVSTNGKVEKAKWEYLGNKSLLIDKRSDSYLFKHGFFDENVLALKVDSSEEYAIFVNENKYEGELNSISKVHDFLSEKYLNPDFKTISRPTTALTNLVTVSRVTNEDKILKIISEGEKTIGAKVYIDDSAAPDGTYIYKNYRFKIVVKNGEIILLYFLEEVKTYIFEKRNPGEPSVGDKIFKQSGEAIQNGVYKYSFFKSFTVENGVIVK
ncbi:hypothetical protein ACFX5D_15950 [Flavobacterium sp. LB3P45]|uniref:Uncharacterized protein n=1 Tax=Flavobacterium fructosi TaxID=3230416 RepID=A0ABW6HQW3_9FLAO